jgi:hypothetical protein
MLYKGNDFKQILFYKLILFIILIFEISYLD